MTASTMTLPKSVQKAALHNWIKHQYVAKKLADLKTAHIAIWESAERTLAEELESTCSYLIEQLEKTQAAKVYITYRLQCQADVIIEGVTLPRSYDPYDGKTDEYDTFEEAWAEFENFVKNIYKPNTPATVKEWETIVGATFDRHLGKFPFGAKMPDWFYERKDYKYNCYLEYETLITEIA